MITVLRTNTKVQAVKNCGRLYQRYGSLLRIDPISPLVDQPRHQNPGLVWPQIPGGDQAGNRPVCPEISPSKVAKKLKSLFGLPRDLSVILTCLNPEVSPSKGVFERWELNLYLLWLKKECKRLKTGGSSFSPPENNPLSEVDPPCGGNVPVHISASMSLATNGPSEDRNHDEIHHTLLPPNLDKDASSHHEEDLSPSTSFKRKVCDHSSSQPKSNEDDGSTSDEEQGPRDKLSGDGDLFKVDSDERIKGDHSDGERIPESQDEQPHPSGQQHKDNDNIVNDLIEKDSEESIEEVTSISVDEVISENQIVPSHPSEHERQEMVSRDDDLFEEDSEENIEEGKSTSDDEDILKSQKEKPHPSEQEHREKPNKDDELFGEVSELLDEMVSACSLTDNNETWEDALKETKESGIPTAEEFPRNSTAEEHQPHIESQSFQNDRSTQPASASSKYTSCDSGARSVEFNLAAGQSSATPHLKDDRNISEEKEREDKENTFQDVMGRVQAMMANVSGPSGQSDPKWMQALGLMQQAGVSNQQQPQSPQTPRPFIPKRKQLHEIDTSFKKPKRLQMSPPVQSPPAHLPVHIPIPAECLFIPVLKETDLEKVLTGRGNPIVLGTGAYGEVHLMRRKSDGNLVAMKRLKDVQDKNHLKAYQDMVSEIRPLVAMQSCEEFPKFIGIIDQTTFVTEFVGDPVTKTSTHLVSVISGPFDLDTLDWIRISLQITRGLQSLHQVGWIHCDLHGGNIMVWRDPKSNKWSAKIIDLGSASRTDTPPPVVHYNEQEKWWCQNLCPQIAPEVVDGFPLSIKTDIYSLGVLLSCKIARDLDALSCIKMIGDRCSDNVPGARPPLTEVIVELESFYNGIEGKDSPGPSSLNNGLHKRLS